METLETVRHRQILIGTVAISTAIGLAMIIFFGLNYAPGLWSAINQDLPALPESPPLLNQAAPDFHLQSLSGQSVQLSAYRGHPVLINFWATWCIPCQQEMPLIEKAYLRDNPQLVVLGVNASEPAWSVQGFVTQTGVTFPILLDGDATVQDLYQVRGFPASYFIDAEGVIRAVHLGAIDETDLTHNLQLVGVGR